MKSEGFCAAANALWFSVRKASGFHAGLAAAQIGCLGAEAGLGRAGQGTSVVWGGIRQDLVYGSGGDGSGR